MQGLKKTKLFIYKDMYISISLHISIGHLKIFDMSDDSGVPQNVSSSGVQFTSLGQLLSLLWRGSLRPSHNNACITGDKGSFNLSD